MFEVVKVVIKGEMPESCFECFYEDRDSCWLINKPLDCTRYERRPSWCPLVLQDSTAKHDNNIT